MLLSWRRKWRYIKCCFLATSNIMLPGNSLRQTVHTHCASVHQAAKLVEVTTRGEITLTSCCYLANPYRMRTFQSWSRTCSHTFYNSALIVSQNCHCFLIGRMTYTDSLKMRPLVIDVACSVCLSIGHKVCWSQGWALKLVVCVVCIGLNESAEARQVFSRCKRLHDMCERRCVLLSITLTACL